MKKVKLSEESYKKLVNEISYGSVERAYDKSDDLFYEIGSAFKNFYNVLSMQDDSNPYIVKIKQLSEEIYGILSRKEKQQDNFFNATTGKVDHRKFNDSVDGDNYDINDMDLNYLQNNYPK